MGGASPSVLLGPGRAERRSDFAYPLFVILLPRGFLGRLWLPDAMSLPEKQLPGK